MTAQVFEDELVPYLNNRTNAQLHTRICDMSKAMLMGDDLYSAFEIQAELGFTIKYCHDRINGTEE